MDRNAGARESRTSSPAAAAARPSRSAPDPSTASRILLGELIKPWGKRGELTAMLYNAASDLLEQVDAVFVGGPHVETRYGVLGARWVGKRYVVRLDGIDSIDRAESLRGQKLSVDADALPPIDGDDEFYVRDLVGMAVVDADGREVGVLQDVLSTGASDVYVVQGPDGESLIPATRDFVIEVDLQTRTMRVHRMEL